MGSENSNGLAGLNQQRLVAFELAQRSDDPVKALPIPRRTTDAAIDDQLARPFGDVRIEVVHQHSERRFRKPALRTDVGAAGCSDRAFVVQSSIHGM